MIKPQSALALLLSLSAFAHDKHEKAKPQIPMRISDLTRFSQSSKIAPTSHSDRKFTFCVVADTQAHDGSGAYNKQVSPAIIKGIESRNPLFTVFPGDLVEDGNVARWKKWLDLTKNLGDNRYIVPGNHDLHPIRRRLAVMKHWQTTFAETLPWVNETAKKRQVGPLLPTDKSDAAFKDRRSIDYYVDHGNTRIVCVATDSSSSENDNNPPGNLEWFRKVMQDPSTKAKENVIVFTHKPITVDGFAGNPDPGGTAWTWWRAISGQDKGSKRADALFTGHYHLYRPGRPQAGETPTMEIIAGTAGGGLECYYHHRYYGFLEIMVEGDRMTARFWGDADGKENGWVFDDVLDTIVIDPGKNKRYSGELTNYNFEGQTGLEDMSKYYNSKHIPLQLKGAEVVSDGKGGKALKTSENKFATTMHLQDHSLALTGDLSLSVKIKADKKLAGKEGDNVILSYGIGQVNGSHSEIPRYKADERNESENYAYILSVDADNKLRLTWQYRAKQEDSDRPTRKKRGKPDAKRLQVETVVSTSSIRNITNWNTVQVTRNSKSKTVSFYVNGQKLGRPVKYQNHATGASWGTLAIGGLVSTTDSHKNLSNWTGLIDEVRIFNNDTGSRGQMIGDCNFDGKFNSKDQRLIESNLGKTFDVHGTMATFAKGDINLDGKVDQKDLDKLKALKNK